ncbi:MAG: SDR family NAD(P)-dependent oxidoreductase [Caldilineaceae bacterium]|nr:SDR family NAD(P)-dependent oxidoreductase [Caldilineaceae bacterium]
MQLKDRVAIVTGASRGIGAAVAEALAQEGCHLILAARSKEVILALAERLRQDYGVRTLALTVDMSDEAQVRSMMAQAEEHFGGVDILINNAGMGIYGAVDEVKMNDLRHVFDVNFFGAVAAMQFVVPGMRRRGGGLIVNVSSIVGKFPSPLGGGYTATKYALEGASAAARAELARDKIKVIVVRPGLTETEFSQHSRVSIPGAESLQGESHAPMRGVPAQKVADRIIRAIHCEEREVYITLFDRLLVLGADAFPGLYAYALQWAAWFRRRRFAQSRGKPTEEIVIALPPWILGLFIAVGALIWLGKAKGKRQKK